MRNPEKIFIIGGMPKSGKRLLVNILGSHPNIAIPPTAISFHKTFSEELYQSRGNYDDNLDFLLNEWRKNETLGLTLSDIPENGNSRKDLYLNMLNAYRAKHFPNKKYFGEYSHNTEFEFNTWLQWFAPSSLKFTYLIRNPFDNYASYLISRNITNKQRSEFSDRPAVHDFCSLWARSSMAGLYRSQKFPDMHKVFFFEDAKKDPESFMYSLCEWAQIKPSPEKMLNMVDYEIKQSSIIEKELNIKYEKITTGGSVNIDSFDRSSLLTTYEKKVIEALSCPHMISAFNYSLNKKQYYMPSPISKKNNIGSKTNSEIVCTTISNLRSNYIHLSAINKFHIICCLIIKLFNILVHLKFNTSRRYTGKIFSKIKKPIKID